MKRISHTYLQNCYESVAIVFSKYGSENISCPIISRTYPLPNPEVESNFLSLESG